MSELLKVDKIRVDRVVRLYDPYSGYWHVSLECIAVANGRRGRFAFSGKDLSFDQATADAVEELEGFGWVEPSRMEGPEE